MIGKENDTRCEDAMQEILSSSQKFIDSLKYNVPLDKRDRVKEVCFRTFAQKGNFNVNEAKQVKEALRRLVKTAKKEIAKLSKSVKAMKIRAEGLLHKKHIQFKEK